MGTTVLPRPFSVTEVECADAGCGNQPVVDSPSKPLWWVCLDCYTAYQGDDTVAQQHFVVPGCFQHWLYEFSLSMDSDIYRMTGRVIHTSARGFYYLDDPLPGSHQPKYSQLALVQAILATNQ